MIYGTAHDDLNAHGQGLGNAATLIVRPPRKSFSLSGLSGPQPPSDVSATVDSLLLSVGIDASWAQISGQTDWLIPYGPVLGPWQIIDATNTYENSYGELKTVHIYGVAGTGAHPSQAFIPTIDVILDTKPAAQAVMAWPPVGTITTDSFQVLDPSSGKLISLSGYLGSTETVISGSLPNYGGLQQTTMLVQDQSGNQNVIGFQLVATPIGRGAFSYATKVISVNNNPVADPYAITKGNTALANWIESQAPLYSDQEIAGFYNSYIAAIVSILPTNGAPANPSPDIYQDLNAQISARGLSLPIIPDCPAGYGRFRPVVDPISGKYLIGYITIAPSSSGHFFAARDIQVYADPNVAYIGHEQDAIDLTTGDTYKTGWMETSGGGISIGTIISDASRAITDLATFGTAEAIRATAQAAGVPDATINQVTEVYAAAAVAVATAGAAAALTAPAASTALVLPTTTEVATMDAAGATILPPSLSLVPLTGDAVGAAVSGSAAAAADTSSILAGDQSATFTVPQTASASGDVSGPTDVSATPLGSGAGATSPAAATTTPNVLTAAGTVTKAAVQGTIVTAATTALATEIKKLTGQLPKVAQPPLVSQLPASPTGTVPAASSGTSVLVAAGAAALFLLAKK